MQPLRASLVVLGYLALPVLGGRRVVAHTSLSAETDYQAKLISLQSQESNVSFSLPGGRIARMPEEPNYAGSEESACVDRDPRSRPCSVTCKSNIRSRIGTMFCCLCPDDSKWVEMFKSCVCSVGVKSGYSFIKPFAISEGRRECPRNVDQHLRAMSKWNRGPQSYIAGAMEMVGLERGFCEARHALDEKSNPDKENRHTLRLGIAYDDQVFDVVTARSLQIHDITANFELQETGKGLQLNIERFTLTIALVDFVYRTRSLKSKLSRDRIAVDAIVDGSVLVQQVMKFGQPLGLNIKIIKVLSSGGKLETSILNWLKKFIFKNVVASIVGNVFSSVAFNLQDVVLNGPLKAAMQGRSPYPLNIKLTPDDCKGNGPSGKTLSHIHGLDEVSSVICQRFTVEAGAKQILPDGIVPLFEGMALLIEQAKVRVDLKNDDLVSRLDATIVFGMDRLLEDICKKQNKKLLAVANGDETEVALVGGEKNIDKPVSPPLESCHEELESPGVLSSFASNVASTAWSATTGTAGYLWNFTAGFFTSKVNVSDAETPGPKRYTIEKNALELFNRQSLRQYGIMKRMGAFDYHIASLKRIDLDISGELISKRWTGEGMLLEGRIALSKLQLVNFRYDWFNVKTQRWEPYGYGAKYTNALTATGSKGLRVALKPTSADARVFLSARTGQIWACVEIGDLALSTNSTVVNAATSLGSWWYDAKRIVQIALDDVVAEMLKYIMDQSRGAFKSAKVIVNLESRGNSVKGKLDFEAGVSWQGLSNLVAHNSAQPPKPVELGKPPEPGLGHGWDDLKVHMANIAKTSDLVDPGDNTLEKIAIDPVKFLAPQIDSFTQLKVRGEYDITATRPLSLTGLFNINLQPMLQSNLNDHGGYDYGHYRNAADKLVNFWKVRSGEVKSIGVAEGVLQCGAVYLLPLDSNYHLFEEASVKNQWLGRFDLIAARDHAGAVTSTLQRVDFASIMWFLKLAFGISREKADELVGRILTKDRKNCFSNSPSSTRPETALYVGKYLKKKTGDYHRSAFFICLNADSDLAKSIRWEHFRFSTMRQMMNDRRGINETAVARLKRKIQKAKSTSVYRTVKKSLGLSKSQSELEKALKEVEWQLANGRPYYNVAHAWMPFNYPVKDVGYFTWSAGAFPVEDGDSKEIIFADCEDQVKSCAEHLPCQGLTKRKTKTLSGACDYLSFREAQIARRKRHVTMIWKAWNVGQLWK